MPRWSGYTWYTIYCQDQERWKDSPKSSRILWRLLELLVKQVLQHDVDTVRKCRKDTSEYISHLVLL